MDRGDVRRGGMWLCGDVRRGRLVYNGEGSWVDKMYARWVSKADVRRWVDRGDS